MVPSSCVQSYPPGPDPSPQQACVTRLGLHRTVPQGPSSSGQAEGKPVDPAVGGGILLAVAGGLVGAALVGTVLLIRNP